MFFGIVFEAISCFIVFFFDAIKRTNAASASKLLFAVPLFAGATLVCWFLAAVCAGFALIALRFRSRISAWLGCIPTILVILLFARAFYLRNTHRVLLANQIGILTAIFISVIFDVLFVVIVRKSLGWMIARPNLTRIIATVLAQFLLLTAMFLIPVTFPVSGGIERSKTTIAASLFMLGVFNFPTSVASLAFIAPLVVVLLDRATWPLLSDWVYVLTRNDVLDRRKTLRALSLLLVAFSLTAIPGMTLFLKLLEKFSN